MPEERGRRVILITGSTDGVGKQTAIDLAANPENFVIVCGKTEEKCQKTVEYIIKENGNSENVDYVFADLSTLKGANKLADDIATRFPSVNTVLCNASVLPPRRQQTKDGMEAGFQVNYLSHFILCNRLVEVMAKNANPRIFMIGSVLHSWTNIDWNDIMAEKEYEKYMQFSRTKLMLHMLGFALHRRMMLARSLICVNVIELGKEKREQNNNCRSRSHSVMSTSDSTISISRTAGNLVTLLESPQFYRLSGKYLDTTGKQIRSGSDATDERLQERLWQLSLEKAGDLIHD